MRANLLRLHINKYIRINWVKFLFNYSISSFGSSVAHSESTIFVRFVHKYSVGAQFRLCVQICCFWKHFVWVFAIFGLYWFHQGKTSIDCLSPPAAYFIYRSFSNKQNTKGVPGNILSLTGGADFRRYGLLKDVTLSKKEGAGSFVSRHFSEDF